LSAVISYDMDSHKGKYKVPRLTVFLMISLLSILFVTGGSTVLADKVETSLSILTDPDDPGYDLPFKIVGILKDGDGNLLGNKKVTLEQFESDNPDANYKFLATATTDINGNYSFFRPDASPAEYLRVKYNGNNQFEGTVSEIIQGHKPAQDDVEPETISSITKSDTKITAKASPSNPSPGQTVVITGQLLGANGKPLNGKKVICEASDRIGNKSDFSILGISTTDENGFFRFGVGGGSTTTYIHIHFTGDDQYEESYSDLIVVL